MEDTHRGRRPAYARSPRKYASGRVCAQSGCTTTLTSYNRRDYCYTHAPTRFPRVRGRVAPSES